MTHHLLTDEYQIFRFLSRSDFVMAWGQPLTLDNSLENFSNSFYKRLTTLDYLFSGIPIFSCLSEN